MPTPAVTQYPTRSAPATRGRRANVTPGRWATIKLIPVGEQDEDYAREDVINISMMIPPERPPELPGLAGAGSGVTNNYFLERVALGVQVGMIRNGTVDAVGGFGYPPLPETEPDPDAVLELSGSTISDTASIGDMVGTLSVTDGSGSYTYALTSNPGSLYAIDGNALEVAGALSAGSNSITIEADIGVDTPISRAFLITVTAPSATNYTSLYLSQGIY
jgi:hypothetical protein